MGFVVIGNFAADQCGSEIRVDVTNNRLTGFKGGYIPISKEAVDAIMQERNKMFKNGVTSLDLTEGLEIINKHVPNFNKGLSDIKPGNKCIS